ncbi:MAG: ATP-binding protein [Clostridia bacterium]|nr:ATP-binding protein [Clostridia bacterium]
MSKIILLCGKIGSGKTTLAKQLEKEKSFVCFSADEKMLKNYGEIHDKNEFREKLAECISQIFKESLSLLQKGISVVLDSGFWTKKERDEARLIFKDFDVELVYLKSDDIENLKRISKRNTQKNAYFFDEETYYFLMKNFEEPINENQTVLETEKDIEKFVLEQ